MDAQEIEERVAASLEALNIPEELYDWRISYYNAGAWANLQEGCYFLSEGKIEEAPLKTLIKTFRDLSQISYIDFRIKVPEPGVAEFRRMANLFGPLRNDIRLIPPRDATARPVYLYNKTLVVMRLVMEHKQEVSPKLRQQFTFLMLRTKERPPELLGVSLNFENYNPYNKRLNPAPAVVLTNHMEEKRYVTEAEIMLPTPVVERMFGSSQGVDNSSFESRLPPSHVKAHRAPGIRKQGKINGVPTEIVVYPYEGDNLLPHELPAQINEEFAAYCQNLYNQRNA